MTDWPITLHSVRELPPLRVWRACEDILEDARKADVEEWQVASGTIFPVALQAAACTEHVWLAIAERDILTWQCLMIFGVTPKPYTGGTGDAWMVATNGAAQRAHDLHRLYKQGISMMHEVCPKLNAWAYHKNLLHHEWMRRMGFRDTKAEIPMGPFNASFRLFQKDAP